MTHVVVRNGNIESALKKFKQKVTKSGIPSEFKKRSIIENLVLEDEKLRQKQLKIPAEIVVDKQEGSAIKK